MNAPSLSVVVPVYNAESKIGRCLDSILCQKVENIEIICVNDGSTDNSLNVLQQYAAKYTSVIKVISQSNKGVSVARNEGMKYAKNDFVMFVDADDYILEGALTAGMSLLNIHDCDLYMFTMERKSRSGIVLKGQSCDDIYNFTPPNAQYFEFLSNYDELTFGSPCCKFYRRYLLEKYKVTFEENIKLFEDACFNYRYLSVCNNVCTSSVILYHYDVSEDNTTSKFHGEVFMDCYLNYLNTVKTFLQDKGLSEEHSKKIMHSKMDSLAYNTVFEIYALYRSEIAGKYGWLKKMLALANKNCDAPFSSYLKSGFPYIIGLLSKYTTLTLHICLTMVFGGEKVFKK